MIRVYSRIIREEVPADSSAGGGAPEGSILSTPAEPAPVTPDPAIVPVEPAPIPLPEVTFPENWKQGLSEDIRNDANLGTINSVNDLAKSLINAQKMIGSDKVVIPGKHGTDDDWKAVYNKLGLPSDIKGYEVTVPKNANFNDGFITQIKEQAFRQGILPKQLTGLLEWYSEANNKAVEEQGTENQQFLDAEMGKLKQEFGEAYNQKINVAKNLIEASGLEGIHSWLDDSGMGNDPNLIRLLAALGDKFLGEDQIVGNEEFSGQNTPNGIKQEISTIQGNPEHPVNQKGHPNHVAALKDLEGLFKRLHPAQ